MTYVVTPEQMRAAEQRAIESGRSESELMKAAARGIAAWVDATIFSIGDQKTAIGLAGPGKNGGDTLLALAELIDLGWTASAVLIDRGDTSELAKLSPLVSEIEIVSDLSAAADAHIILDGVYGLGGRAALPEHVANLFQEAAAMRRHNERIIVAVDVPSGIDSLTGEADDAALQCDATLCIGHLKAGLLHEPTATLASDIAIIDIQIEPPVDEEAITVIDSGLVRDLLPYRAATAGKHDHGGLLVIGGAPMYFGAPRLAAEAALKVGTGLVGVAVPRMLISTIAAQVPEVVYLPLSDSNPSRSVKDLTEALSGADARYTAAVLGPGLGRDEPAKALLDRLFGQATMVTTAPIGFGAFRGKDSGSGPATSALASVPVVLDADALNWLSEQENWPALLENVTAVLTPHHGEMARLLGISTDEVKANPRKHAREAARKWGQVVVLKGGFTSVGAPDGRLSVAHRATPELATPGTGDVLAGIIGGFLAQGVDPYDAAQLSVCIGARAAQYTRQHRSSRSVIARNLIAELDSVLFEFDFTPWWI